MIGLLTKGSQAQSNALYHKAFKKIEHCDPDTWETVVPQEENGWKFELFLHNFMPMIEAGKLGILQVDRETEFGPVKAADANDGTIAPDTPAMARQMILKEATTWLAGAETDGLRIDASARGNIEVSFLLSYAGENLAWLKHMYKRQPINGQGGYLNHEGEYTELE